jgi:hypothetical protein
MEKGTPASLHPGAGPGRGGSERITVALIPRAVEDLRKLHDRTGMSKTDLTNRAISLYEFVEGCLRAGNDVLVHDRETGETQSIRLL